MQSGGIRPRSGVTNDVGDGIVFEEAEKAASSLEEEKDLKP
jgi:hypothetical protein